MDLWGIHVHTLIKKPSFQKKFVILLNIKIFLSYVRAFWQQLRIQFISLKGHTLRPQLLKCVLLFDLWHPFYSKDFQRKKKNKMRKRKQKQVWFFDVSFPFSVSTLLGLYKKWIALKECGFVCSCIRLEKLVGNFELACTLCVTMTHVLLRFHILHLQEMDSFERMWICMFMYKTSQAITFL